jgi:fructokinase
MLIPSFNNDGSDKNACVFHDFCLEGFASGKSLELIYGHKAEHISDDVVWEKEASYIAKGIMNIVCTLSPDMIIIGGGVSRHRHLVVSIRQHLAPLIDNYVALPPLDRFIVHTSSDAIGVLGAIKLASL